MFWIVLITAALLIAAPKKWSWTWVMISWPGTVLHETMHWSMGKLLNGQPSELSVFPTRTEEGMDLGYVTFENLTWYNSLPIAVAPLLTVPLAYWLSGMIPPEMTWTSVVAVWALASGISMSWPSPQDWSLLARYPTGSAIWVSVAGALIYINMAAV